MGNAIDNTLDRLFRNSAATMALRAREGNTFVQPPVQPEAPPAPVGTVSIPQGEPVDLLSMVRSMSPGEVTRETIPAPSPGEVTRETDISQRGRALRELETLFLGIRNSLEPMTPDAQIAAMNRIQEAVAPKTPLTPTERVGELVRLVSAGALPSAAKGLGELGPAVAKSAKSGTLREIATSERGTIGKEPPKVPEVPPSPVTPGAAPTAKEPAIASTTAPSRPVPAPVSKIQPAEAQTGAPITLTGYHGTDQTFSAFDPSKLGGTTQARSAKLAIFYSTDPRVAESYAEGAKYLRGSPEVIAARKELAQFDEARKWGQPYDKKRVGELGAFVDKEESRMLGDISGANIRQEQITLKNPYVIDIGGKSLKKWSNDIGDFAANIEYASKNGYDGVIYKNAFEGGLDSTGKEIVTTHVAVFPAPVSGKVEVPAVPTKAGEAPMVSPTDLMPDLQNIDEAITVGTEATPIRKLATVPVVKPLAKLIGGGAATATKPAELAEVGRNALMQEAETKVSVATSYLEKLGNSRKVFDIKEGVVSKGVLKGETIGDIAANPAKFSGKLTPEQQAWIDQWNALDEAKLNLLKRNDIKINELSFEEGGKYTDRIVYGKVDKEGKLIEAAFIGGGPRGVGGKVSQEMTRVFKTEAEAIKDGFKYLPPEEAFYHNARAAYARIANKQYADWLLERIPWRTTEAFSLVKANKLLNGALKKTPITEQSLNALRRDMPAVAKLVEAALAETDWSTRFAKLKDIKTYIRTLEPTAKENLAFAVDKLTQRRQLAETAIDAIQRAKRGERLPTGTVNAIKKILPQADKLSAATKSTLGDLIRAGEEAATYPKTLKVPTPGTLAKYKKLIQEATDALAANPDSIALQRQLKKLKQGYTYAKYRIAKGEPIEFSKSPVSILKGPQFEALDEFLLALRGKPVESVTATGKKITKYEGGLLKDFRKQELEAKNLRTEVRAQALRPKFEEMAVPYPAFSGRIFTGSEAKETAAIIKATIEPRYSEVLGAVNTINSIGRYFVLAGDASLFGIQLIFALFRHPIGSAKTAAGFTRALFDPKFLPNYIVKNAPIINKSSHLIIPKGGTTEFTEAMGRGGFLRKGPLKFMGTPLEPFQRAFETGLTVAGVETRKSLDYLATTPARAAQVDAYVNKFRGVTSSAQLGIGKTQRQSETAVTLAPQYNRAVASILTDVFRGNIRGKLAREYLLAGVTGVAATSIAISLARGETWEEVVEHLDPTSSKFLTWDVGGQQVGPGSKVRSILILLAKSVHNPKDLLSLAMDNPAFRFVRSNFSPAVSTGYDLLTGTNYLGDPSRDGLLTFGKTVIGENLVPSWIQQGLMEGDISDINGIVTRGTVGFFGGRAYPQTAYQKLDVLRNKLAAQNYPGMDWEDLGAKKGKIYQEKLMKQNPQLQALYDQAQLESSKMALGDQKVWSKFNTEGRSIEKLANDTIAKATAELGATGDGKTFREKVDATAQDKRFAYDLRKNKKEYRIIEDYFAEPLDEATKKKLNKNDLARKEYYTKMYAPGMYDLYGNYKFDEADKIEESFVKEYGQEALDYVKDAMGISRLDMPAPYRMLKEDRITLRPYWEIQEKYGEDRDADFKSIYRVGDPDADAALNLWGYSSIANSPEGLKQLRTKVAELGINPKDIPALQPDKTDPRVMWDRGIDFVPKYLRDYWYEEDRGWDNKKLTTALDVLAIAKDKERDTIKKYEDLPSYPEYVRDRYRQQNPEVDVALNIWGRVSTVKSSKAMTMLKDRATELGIPYEALPISPQYKMKEAKRKIEDLRQQRTTGATTSQPTASGGLLDMIRAMNAR